MINFKALEQEFSQSLSPEKLYGFRLDGINFKRLTAPLEKPFSPVFEEAMDSSLTMVVKLLPKTLLAYVASDELSLVVPGCYLPYSGRLEKLLPAMASYATIGFLEVLPDTLAAFDARAFELGPTTLLAYITDRRLNTRKNAVTMAAGALHSHRRLLGVPLSERVKLLEGTPWERIPGPTFEGRFLTPEGNLVVATREEAETRVAGVLELWENLKKEKEL